MPFAGSTALNDGVTIIAQKNIIQRGDGCYYHKHLRNCGLIQLFRKLKTRILTLTFQIQ
jgi:hypothetical protein